MVGGSPSCDVTKSTEHRYKKKLVKLEDEKFINVLLEESVDKRQNNLFSGDLFYLFSV